MLKLVQGDCLQVLKTLDSDSIDALVTDPPAGISFMGKAWDSNKGGREQWISWLSEVMGEVIRVLKPGAHGLVWALPRTSHWTATALENAGFEIRDVVTHLFGTGFPKSLDVAKAIDKSAGISMKSVPAGGVGFMRPDSEDWHQTKNRMLWDGPVTDEAKRWQGWGTALKPAAEFWILCRKPLVGTVAANVLEFGTGALNIDGCRIGEESRVNQPAVSIYGTGMPPDALPKKCTGRWPANLIVDDEAAEVVPRFFYVPKASKAERERGCGNLPRQALGKSALLECAEDRATSSRNHHPTVKPLALMRYLIRLITPPGGTVLDCFMGSGSTGIAALEEGFSFVGIEREEEYFAVAAQRIAI